MLAPRLTYCIPNFQVLGVIGKWNDPNKVGWNRKSLRNNKILQAVAMSCVKTRKPKLIYLSGLPVDSFDLAESAGEQDEPGKEHIPTVDEDSSKVMQPHVNTIAHLLRKRKNSYRCKVGIQRPRIIVFLDVNNIWVICSGDFRAGFLRKASSVGQLLRLGLLCVRHNNLLCRCPERYTRGCISFLWRTRTFLLFSLCMGWGKWSKFHSGWCH